MCIKHSYFHTSWKWLVSWVHIDIVGEQEIASTSRHYIIKTKKTLSTNSVYSDVNIINKVKLSSYANSAMKCHRYFIGFNLGILCWLHVFSFTVLQIGEKMAIKLVGRYTNPFKIGSTWFLECQVIMIKFTHKNKLSFSCLCQCNINLYTRRKYIEPSS